MSIEAMVDTKPFNQIPGPKAHWLLGNIGQFDKTLFHRFCFQQAKDFGAISKIRFMHKSILIVSRAETVQRLLKDRPEGFRRASNVANVFKDMGLEGAFTTEGKQWQRQRRLINPAFTPAKLKQFYPKIQAITQHLCQTLALETQGHQSAEMHQLFMRYTVDITSSLAFGAEINTLQNPELELQQHLSRIFPMISQRLRSGFPYWKYFKREQDRELEKSLRFVEAQVENFIHRARDRLQHRAQTMGVELDAVGTQDVLEAMIQSKDENGLPFSKEELFGNVMTLLLAGEDTTANTLAWTIDGLAEKPDVQDEIFAEIQENYPENAALSLQDLDKFPLTFAAAQESMRLKPVAPYTFLENNQDTTIEGYYIPKGTAILVILSHDGQDSKLFPKPEQFDIHRWLAISDEQRKEAAQRLMLFGYGPRLCPGRQLAFVEMKLALIEILKRFKFTRTDSQKAAKEITAFTLAPDKVEVTVQLR